LSFDRLASTVILFNTVASPYRWDDFTLDLDAYRLTRAGVALPLEPKAFNLLVLLVQRPGHLFTKQEIFDAIWPGTAVTDHALTRVVAQLRRVMGEEAREARYIETVPTRGYRWIRPIDRAEDDAAASPPDPSHTSSASDHRFGPGVVGAISVTTVVVSLLIWTQRGPLTSTKDAAGPYTTTAAGSTSSPDVAWPVQLTTNAGLDLQPALSPLGDAMAYVSDRTGAFEIYLRALDGAGTDSPLTSDSGQNVQPAWSPNGLSIAYHSYRLGGIWVMPARGGVARQIASVGSNPAWSPDGSRIAFQSDEHADVNPRGWAAQSGSTIWTVRADGGDLREETHAGSPTGGHASPAWSNDGRYLAFTVFEGGIGSGVWLLHLKSKKTRLLARGGGLFELVFAPDDSALYVAGGEAAIVRLVFDAVSGIVRGRRLIPVPGVPGVRGLSIAPDGKRIAFAGPALSSQIWAQPVGVDGIATRPPYALTSDTSRRNSLPSVSPDGSKVAYMSTPSGRSANVWVIGVDGLGATQLTANSGGGFEPSWFPDGRRVAFVSKHGHRSGVWSVDVTTRREELIVDFARHRAALPGGSRLPGRLAEVALAPSLKRAAFSLLPPPGRRVLYVTDITPYAPRALTNGTVSVGYPAWSPDERSLAVEIKDGSSTQAAIVDAATGAMRWLTKDRGQTWVRSWSPDGKKVAVAALREGVWDVRWIDATTGRQQVITPAGPPHVYFRYPEWSPRGDLVVFERGELKANIWTLEVQ
jgi:Tol biopolymer transport system component/DNA-binding winged helix-turn-helix (wHTH) protein